MELRNCLWKNKKHKKFHSKNMAHTDGDFINAFMMCFYVFIHSFRTWFDQAMNMFGNEYEYLLYNNNFSDWKSLHYFRNANKAASGFWKLHTCSNSIIIIWNNHITILTLMQICILTYNCTIFKQKGTFYKTKTKPKKEKPKITTYLKLAIQ